MKFLLFLARFHMDADLLRKKLTALGKGLSFKYSKGVLEVDAVSFDLQKALALDEVERAVKLVSSWKVLNFKDLKESSLSAMKGQGKEFKIQTKFYQKIPLSARSLYKHINPYLKHEGFKVDEENWKILLYLEVKKEGDKKFFRLGISERDLWEKASPVSVKMDFTLVLENPRLKEEVSDFLRLSWIFRLPLIIVTKDRSFEKVLRAAKKETKGIDYDKFSLKIVSKMPSGTLVGFSKFAKKTEKDLKPFLSKNKKLFLVFGDDTFGLSQEARDKLDISFRLTPESKKPLRASHALSYVLGMYTAQSI